MWYILYLKIVKAVGRRRRDSNLSLSHSWHSLLHYSHRVVYNGRGEREKNK